MTNLASTRTRQERKEKELGKRRDTLQGLQGEAKGVEMQFNLRTKKTSNTTVIETAGGKKRESEHVECRF